MFPESGEGKIPGEKEQKEDHVYLCTPLSLGRGLSTSVVLAVHNATSKAPDFLSRCCGEHLSLQCLSSEVA